MDNSVLLTLIVALLALNLLLVGFYLVLVLNDVRTTLKKVNTLLDTTAETADSVSRPIQNVSHIAEAFTNGLEAVNLVRTVMNKYGHTHHDSVSSIIDNQKGGRNVRL